MGKIIVNLFVVDQFYRSLGGKDFTYARFTSM